MSSAATAAAAASAAALSPYMPSSIHMSGNVSQFFTGTGLTTGGGAVADTSVMLCSLWMRGVQKTSAQSASFTSATNYIVQMASNIQVAANTDAEHVPGLTFLFDNPSGVYGSLRICFGAADETPANSHNCNMAPIAGQGSTDWVHYLFAVDTSNSGSTTKRFALYVNGVKQVSGITAWTSSAFTFSPGNANGFAIGQYAGLIPGTTSGTFDIAELCVSFTTNGGLDGSNNLPAATIALFIDANGNPVNPINLVANLGVTPEILMRGDKTGFVTNQGSVTNTFTKTNIFTGSYGPGPIRPKTVRVIGAYGESTPASGTTQTTVDTNIAVKTGDLILFFASILDQSTLHDHAVGLPSGFTLISRNSPTSNTLNSTVVGWKIAAADGESTAYSYSWTTAASRAGRYCVTVLRGADQSNPIDNSSYSNYGAASNTTAFAGPAITPVASNCLLLDIISGWNSAQAFAPITGEDQCYRAVALVQNQQTLTSNAAVAARACTASPSDGGCGYSITILPA